MSNQSFRFMLGTFDCIVINDGSFAYPQPASLFFTNSPEEELEQVLYKHNLEQWQEYVSPYPCLVINTEQQLILVDTGAGDMAPTTGNLIQNLRAGGIAPGEIGTVILTHGHPDHIGGNLDSNGKPAFPNARYVMMKDEWEFWTSEPDLSTIQADEHVKELVDHIKQLLITCARNNLPPIQGQLDLVDQETEIVSGIKIVPVPGHTPGHMAVTITSEGSRLHCISDAAIHPIHLEQPDWYSVFDLAPEQGLAARRQLMDMAADENAVVHAFHFPWPGLGHVIRDGEKWLWQPI